MNPASGKKSRNKRGKKKTANKGRVGSGSNAGGNKFELSTTMIMPGNAKESEEERGADFPKLMVDVPRKIPSFDLWPDFVPSV